MSRTVHALNQEPGSPAIASAADIRAVVPQLVAPRESIESAFLDVGAQLGQSATILNRISSVFEALPRDLESPEMAEATARLAAVGEQAEEISGSFAAEQNDIARLVSVVVAADQPISALRRAVKMMGIVAINARVVAAGVIGEIEDFDVFTTDIATLSDSATQTIGAFTVTYRQLTEEVHRAAEQRAQFEATHSDTLGTLAEGLRGHLAGVTERRQASADSSAETGRVSRQIVGRVASAVMALQVGDSTRQRIEHVESALTLLADLLEGIGSDDLVLPDDEQAAAVASIVALQCELLAGATQAFDDEVSQAEQALGELASDAQTIMASSRDVYGQQGASGESSITALSLELRRAVTVLRDCEAQRSKLGQVAAAVQATVQVLLQHVEAVQEIEANMRLVSLNAAIKCAQLGPRGRALNVIARQLRELTGETVEAAEAAMASLADAASLAQSFSDASSGEAAGRVARLEQEAIAAVDLLETVDQRLKDALGVLNQDGPSVINLLGRAASTFSHHSDLSEAMRDAGIQIQSLATTEELSAPGDATRAVLDRLRKSYTMEAERRTHTNLFGAAAAQAEPEPAPAEESLDDLFF